MFVIPFKTPTINHLYYHRGNMKILSKEARELRAKIEELLDKEHIHEAVEVIKENDCKLRVLIRIQENWLTKKGEVKRKDIANREKFLIDSVFNALGIDDKMIYEHTSMKVQGDDECAIVNIEEFE